MLKATFERTSTGLPLIGDTATWELELFNTGTDTEVVTSNLVTPYMVTARTESLTEGTAIYSNGATGGGNVHTMPPGAKVIIRATYVVPNVDGIRVTPVYTLSWPKQTSTLRLSNGQTLTLDPNFVELEADPILVNYSDHTEHLEARNAPGRIMQWIDADLDGSSHASMVDALASGVNFEDWVRSDGVAGASQTPGPLFMVTAENANGTATAVAWRRELEVGVPASGYQYFDQTGTAIPAPAGALAVRPIRVSTLDAVATDWDNALTLGLGLTQPFDFILHNPAGNQDSYRMLRNFDASAWEAHEVA